MESSIAKSKKYVMQSCTFELNLDCIFHSYLTLCLDMHGLYFSDKYINNYLFFCSFTQGGPSSLSVYALRLGPGEEIVTSLFKFVQEKELRAPFVITCVGSVTKATLRLANADAVNRNEVPDRSA